jgi:hypothetical protein
VTPHDDDEPPAGTPAEGRGEDDDPTLSSVSVTVDEEHLADMSRVVEALRERGMQVEAVLEGLGMVTGRAPDTEVLRQVEGVSAVDAVMERHVPPPEDEIQ